MLSYADLEDVQVERIQCRRCGTSWLKRDPEERPVCHFCGSPYMEDEERNVIRKN